MPITSVDFTKDNLRYYSFDPASKTQFEAVRNLISINLSEPYSIYVYWYFFHQWPQYCFLVSEPGSEDIIGVLICKIDAHRAVRMRGYIGMLVIDPKHRGKGIAKTLVTLGIEKMIEWGQVDEIMLETETSNAAALLLYELFGFLRTKRMYRYYLNGSDAFRLIYPVLDRLFTRIAFLDRIADSESPKVL